jgi:hypothetical protein
MVAISAAFKLVPVKTGAGIQLEVLAYFMDSRFHGNGINKAFPSLLMSAVNMRRWLCPPPKQRQRLVTGLLITVTETV